MKKEHRIAFIKQAIETIEHHTPCLESYVRIHFEKYVRKCKHFKKDVNLDEFYQKIPEALRVLRADGPVAEPYDAELLEELKEDLEALAPPPPKNKSNPGKKKE